MYMLDMSDTAITVGETLLAPAVISPIVLHMYLLNSATG